MHFRLLVQYNTFCHLSDDSEYVPSHCLDNR
jgi:hypothetical protein